MYTVHAYPCILLVDAVCLSVQDAAVELLLRHPRLAITPKQLAHLSALITDLPESISIPLDGLQQVLVKRPNLVRYSSVKALAAKVTALKPLFPGQAGVLICGGELQHVWLPRPRNCPGPVHELHLQCKTCA
jgi:hypothetical protein